MGTESVCRTACVTESCVTRSFAAQVARLPRRRHTATNFIAFFLELHVPRTGSIHRFAVCWEPAATTGMSIIRDSGTAIQPNGWGIIC